MSLNLDQADVEVRQNEFAPTGTIHRHSDKPSPRTLEERWRRFRDTGFFRV